MKTKHNWSRLDAMNEEQRHATVLADPDLQPLSDADMDRMHSALGYRKCHISLSAYAGGASLVMLYSDEPRGRMSGHPATRMSMWPRYLSDAPQ